MLELDIVLERFVKQLYPELSQEQQAIYRRLLECEDQQLFDWFLKKQVVNDTELASMVEQILEFQAQSQQQQ
jgi:antitoxin CptB